MAKVGYIFLAEAYESVESDKAWMEKFGSRVESPSHES